jgi:hypothetical protein
LSCLEVGVKRPLIPQVRGRHGEVTVVGIGAVIGRFDGEGGFWELTALEPEKQEKGKPIIYRLRAVLSYVNPAFWEATKADGTPRFKKRVVLRVGQNLFRIDVADGQRMELHGRVLQSEGVILCQIEN